MDGRRSVDEPDTVDYIRSMLGSLKQMARGQNLKFLGYLIEVAELEASDQLKRYNATPTVTIHGRQNASEDGLQGLTQEGS